MTLQTIAEDLALIELAFINLKAMMLAPPPTPWKSVYEYEKYRDNKTKARTAKYSIGDSVQVKASGQCGHIVGIHRNKMQIRVLFKTSIHPRYYWPEDLTQPTP